jgi:hypothetical protein
LVSLKEGTYNFIKKFKIFFIKREGSCQEGVTKKSRLVYTKVYLYLSDFLLTYFPQCGSGFRESKNADPDGDPGHT